MDMSKVVSRLETIEDHVERLRSIENLLERLVEMNHQQAQFLEQMLQLYRQAAAAQAQAQGQEFGQ